MPSLRQLVTIANGVGAVFSLIWLVDRATVRDITR